ncbi:MAG: hypothetical protein WCG83_01575 [Candidatus Peregrinibacteria bacterium]
MSETEHEPRHLALQSVVDLTTFSARMETIAGLAMNRTGFDPGADLFCKYLRDMRQWSGDQLYVDLRREYGEESREIFLNLETVGGRDRLERDARSINDWLKRSDWSGSAVTAEDLERLIFLSEEKREVDEGTSGSGNS